MTASVEPFGQAPLQLRNAPAPISSKASRCDSKLPGRRCETSYWAGTIWYSATHRYRMIRPSGYAGYTDLVPPQHLERYLFVKQRSWREL